MQLNWILVYIHLSIVSYAHLESTITVLYFLSLQEIMYLPTQNYRCNCISPYNLNYWKMLIVVL